MDIKGAINVLDSLSYERINGWRGELWYTAGRYGEPLTIK